MQPSATASIPPSGEMDIQAMQSMDWLFKKERIYLLAQFWQQVSCMFVVQKKKTTKKNKRSKITRMLIQGLVRSELRFLEFCPIFYYLHLRA